MSETGLSEKAKLPCRVSHCTISEPLGKRPKKHAFSLAELNAYIDANAGTFSEAEITFMQGLAPKTLSFRASRQVQSVVPFLRIPRTVPSYPSRAAER